MIWRCSTPAGNTAVAAGLFRKALAAKPDFAAAWTGLGQASLQLGKKEEAASAFDQANRAARGELGPVPAAEEPASIAELERKLSGTQLLSVHLALASRFPVFTPATLPRPSLSDLFDRYAPDFDEMLVNTLKYQVPQQIADAVAAARLDADAKPIDILDLGCGTGLCGKLLKPIANRLCGVDLSTGMIEKAKSAVCMISWTSANCSMP